MIIISMSIKLAIVLDIHHAIVTIVTIPKLFTTVFLLGYLSPIVPRSQMARVDDPVDGFYCRIPSGNSPRTRD